MKKLLLSSIIMLGVCSFATAQNAATGSKPQKATAATNSFTPAPQKSAATTGSETIVGDDGVARPAKVQAVAAKPADVVAVDAMGGTTVTTEQIAKKKEMQKAAEAKPTTTSAERFKKN